MDTMCFKTRKDAVKRGFSDGLVIGIGYFFVCFALGIYAKKLGVTSLQGIVLCVLNMASAGQYAALNAFALSSTIIETILLIAVTNARYLLWSASLSQKLSPNIGVFKRLLIAQCVTDEMVAVSLGKPGYIRASYFMSMLVPTATLWAGGCVAGILAGDVLPVSLASALGVALYGMLIAVYVPPARRDKIILVLVILCCIISYACTKLPYICDISANLRLIVFSIVISAIVSIIFPVKDKEKEAKNE